MHAVLPTCCWEAVLCTRVSVYVCVRVCVSCPTLPVYSGWSLRSPRSGSDVSRGLARGQAAAERPAARPVSAPGRSWAPFGCTPTPLAVCTLAVSCA